MPKSTVQFLPQAVASQCATRVVLSLALLIAVQSAPAQSHAVASKAPSPRLQERIFHSNVLDRDMHYMVVLPASYRNSQRRYPVLYLLHGWAGDYTNWVKLTKLIEYSRLYPIIIVTPDANNSWYVNSATVPGDRFEDYIIHDLIPEIDAHWRTLASRDRRSVAGLSMGGYGSVLFGLKHSNIFAVVGSVSGAFDGPSGVERIIPDVRESTDRAYGPAGSPTRLDNDLYSLAQKAGPSVVPYLFLECGSEDSLLPSNRKFVEELSLRKVSYEYHEYSGAHTWEFWDHSLPMLLKVIAARIVPGDKRRVNAFEGTPLQPFRKISPKTAPL